MITKIIKITTLTITLWGMIVIGANNCFGTTAPSRNEIVAVEAAAKKEEPEIVTEKNEVGQIVKGVDKITREIASEKEQKEADEERKRWENYDKNPYQITNTYETKYVRNDVAVRSGAGLGFNKLGTIEKGTMVLVTGKTDNGWCRIQSEYGIAYISSGQLSVNKPVVEEKESENSGAIMLYLPTEIQTTYTTSPIYEATVIDWINDARKATGLNELVKDESLLPSLMKIVELKSQDKKLTFSEELNGAYLITTVLNHSNVQSFINTLMEDEKIRTELLSGKYSRIQYYAISGDPGYIGIIIMP